MNSHIVQKIYKLNFHKVYIYECMAMKENVTAL